MYAELSEYHVKEEEEEGEEPLGWDALRELDLRDRRPEGTQVELGRPPRLAGNGKGRRLSMH